LDRRKLEKRNQRGLTLVELLVVVVILALASSVVMLNAPPSRPEVRDDAERFAARLLLAFDQAVASDESIRVRIDAKGYSFEELRYSEELGDEEWAVDENVVALSRRDYHRRTSVIVEADDAANKNALALGDDDTAKDGEEEGVSTIPLDPLGAQMPFRVRFSSADGVLTVRVDETGTVRVSDDD